jgi:hypothetical protein
MVIGGFQLVPHPKRRDMAFVREWLVHVFVLGAIATLAAVAILH